MSSETKDYQDDAICARFQLSRPANGKAAFSLDVELNLPGNGITAIFGHSGSGKTTLLRCIAGLESPDQGKLIVNGDCWHDGKQSLPTHKRPIGYVFQESSLFPHLSAKGNLKYAIKRSATPVEDSFYKRVVEVMGIESILDHYPEQLSGGERQRVSIARALLIQPQLLLMDEPLASLDSARKQEILPYLEKLHTTFDTPVLYVSHSMDEVARLADHTVVLDQGKVIAQGSVTNVFSRIDFSLPFDQNSGVVILGKVAERDRQWHLSRIVFDGGELWVRDGGDELGQEVRVRILARDVSLTEQPCDQSSILNRIRVTVTEIADDRDEAMSLVRLQAGTEYLIARLTRRSVHHLQLESGKELWAQIKSVAVVR